MDKINFLDDEIIQVISCDGDDIAPIINSGEYIPIDAKKMGSASMFMQHLPMLIAGNELAKSYRMVMPHGVTGELIQYKKGGVGNIIVGDDGKFAAHAQLYSNSASTGVVASAFAVASVIVGQYYMSEINQSMERLQKTANDILNFLEAEAQSELSSVRLYVEYLATNFAQISSNNVQQQAAITTLHKNFVTLRKWNAFCGNKLHNLSDEASNVKKDADGWATTFGYTKYAQMYNFTCELFSISTALEVGLTRECSQDYIDNRRNDIMSLFKENADVIVATKKPVERFLARAKKAPDFNTFDNNANNLFRALRLDIDKIQEDKSKQEADLEAQVKEVECAIEKVQHQSIASNSYGMHIMDRITICQNKPLEIAYVDNMVYLKLPDDSRKNA